MHELGRYLQREIDRRGWTIAELARRATVSRQTVYSLVNDTREQMDQTPQRKTVNALAEALGVDPLEILTASAQALGVPVEVTPTSDSLGHVSDQQILMELASRLSRSKGQDNESTSTDEVIPPRLRAVAPEGNPSPGQKTESEYGIAELHGDEARSIPVPPRERLAAHPKVKTRREQLDEETGGRGADN